MGFEPERLGNGHLVPELFNLQDNKKKPAKIKSLFQSYGESYKTAFGLVLLKRKDIRLENWLSMIRGMTGDH
jgi:hypothetical protein